MRLLKFMGKVLVFPVMLIVTVIQWLFTFLVGLSSVIFNLLAGLFMLIAVGRFLIQIMFCFFAGFCPLFLHGLPPYG